MNAFEVESTVVDVCVAIGVFELDPDIRRNVVADGRAEDIAGAIIDFAGPDGWPVQLHVGIVV